MAPHVEEVKAGDLCPIDGGAFVVDDAQDPDKVIDRHTRNAHSPFVAARFAERVREKTKDHGVIHKCVTCGYRSRFKPADAEGGNAAAGEESGGNRSAAGASGAGARGAARGGKNAAAGTGTGYTHD